MNEILKDHGYASLSALLEDLRATGRGETLAAAEIIELLLRGDHDPHAPGRR